MGIHSWDKTGQMGMNRIEDTEEMKRDDATWSYEDLWQMKDNILWILQDLAFKYAVHTSKLGDSQTKRTYWREWHVVRAVLQIASILMRVRKINNVVQALWKCIEKREATCAFSHGVLAPSARSLFPSTKFWMSHFMQLHAVPAPFQIRQGS